MYIIAFNGKNICVPNNGLKTKRKGDKSMSIFSGFSRKATYITLGVTAAAVAAAGIVSYNQAATKVDSAINYSFPAETSISDSSSETSQAVAQMDVPDLSSVQENSAVEAIKTFTKTMPVTGEVIGSFSGGELVKNPTTGIWTTHDGIDIAAPSGTKVKSVGKGVVKQVYQDTLWGYCVVVQQEDLAVSHYYNLDKAVMVKEGDELNAGDIIGAVGDTAQVELSLKYHLHYGVKVNDQWVDPIKYINNALDEK